MDTFNLAPEPRFQWAEGAGQSTQLYNSVSESVCSVLQPKLWVLRSASIPPALAKIPVERVGPVCLTQGSPWIHPHPGPSLD